jgi:phosphopantetheinyl transferase (holo-ACP synthase)
MTFTSKKSALKTIRWVSHFSKWRGETKEVFERQGGGKLHLSITHEGDIALAFVVWEV